MAKGGTWIAGLLTLPTYAVDGAVRPGTQGAGIGYALCPMSR